ncbi:MAG: DUF4402 domain-containing protein, partial [Bacteroidales bacterium]|nr:DUF4402 domain-containing protein [Bacteroidales bacterium]
MMTATGIIKQGLKQFFLLLCFLSVADANAQEPPPRPIRIDLVQNLSFGAFYQGPSGGSITIDPTGTRSSTGDVIPI